MEPFFLKRPLFLWILTVIITLASVVYQRVTGPSHPFRGSIEMKGEKIKFELLRTHVTTNDARMEIAVPSPEVTGELRWRRFRSHDDWTTENLAREGDNLVVTIPKQPPAGKVMYEITLADETGKRHALTETPVIMRFKGAVPSSVLWPHIILMFAAMLLATRTGLEAIAKRDRALRLAVWTSGLLFVGGLVFGPIVQKYAFGSYWTGWPFGHDLTDTKTGIAMIVWLVALWRGRDIAKGRIWMIIAALVTLLVYLIPHSVLGSELDYMKMSR
jgi:hypothetical protein